MDVSARVKISRVFKCKWTLEWACWMIDMLIAMPNFVILDTSISMINCWWWMLLFINPNIFSRNPVHVHVCWPLFLLVIAWCISLPWWLYDAWSSFVCGLHECALPFMNSHIFQNSNSCCVGCCLLHVAWCCTNTMLFVSFCWISFWSIAWSWMINPAAVKTLGF